MLFGLTSNELTGYAGSIIFFAWGVWQYKSKLKLENQKIKYVTYSKISANVNFFIKSIQSIKYQINVEELKNLEQQINEFETNFEKRRTGWSNKLEKTAQKNKEVESHIDELTYKIELKENQIIEVKIAEIEDLEIKALKAGLKLNKEKLDDTEKLLDDFEADLDDVSSQLDSQKLSLKEYSNKADFRVFQILDSIKLFLLNFNDISDLQIISSNKIIDQVNFVKLKAEDAQVALNLLVLEHEKLPSVDHSMDLAEIKQLLNENDKLLLFMHKEMNN
jgi:hypothetical protein